jgi:hypothetical protein
MTTTTTGPDGLRDDEREPHAENIEVGIVATGDTVDLVRRLRARLIESRAETEAEKRAHAETRADLAASRGFSDAFARACMTLRVKVERYIAASQGAACTDAQWDAYEDMRVALSAFAVSGEVHDWEADAFSARAEADALKARAEKAEAERDAALSLALRLAGSLNALREAVIESVIPPMEADVLYEVEIARKVLEEARDLKVLAARSTKKEG